MLLKQLFIPWRALRLCESLLFVDGYYLSSKAPSFRAERSGDPESGLFESRTFWIPAFAGMTVFLTICA